MATTNYQSIAEENITRYGTAIDEYGPLLLSDRYSDRTHFVYELLQNAEDAIGWRAAQEEGFSRDVDFTLDRKKLSFRHHGLPFSEEHVRGICNIGKGTKGTDLTAIGKHGIGFKSVYAYTHHPEIHSGDEHFVIDSFVRPKSVEAKPVAFDETLFDFPFDHPVMAGEQAYDEIRGRLQLLGLKTLLFLRNIESVSWETECGGRGQYLRDATLIAEGIEKVTLLGQKEKEQEPDEESWLVFRKQVFNHDQAAGFVELAFELELDEDSEATRHSIVCVNESPLAVFFPTEKETHFGFLIQGPYRTTPSRDNVPKDDSWNQHLVECTADLVVESLLKLREAGFLTVSALEALIIDLAKYDAGSQASMFRPIAEAIIQTLRTESLIPDVGSRHVPGNRARLARAENLRKLLSADQLKQITESQEVVEWVSGDITRERTSRLRNFLVGTLDIEEIDAESFVRRITQEFLEQQSDDWIRTFYEFLLDQHAIRRQVWFNTKPIIRLSTGKHVVPTTDGKSYAYLPSDDRTEFPTVKDTVCSSDGSLKLLKDLGLKEPDPVDDVIHNILPRYTEQATDFPPEFDCDVERIVEAFQTDSARRRTELVSHLKEASWIPCRNAETDELALATTENDTYLPTQKLLELFTGNSEVWFVDRTRTCLQGKKCQAVLEACGSAEQLHRTKVACDLSPSELSSMRRQAGLQRSTSEVKSDYRIEGLDETLKLIVEMNAGWEESSFLLWDSLHDAIRYYREGFLFGEYRWSYSHESRNEKFAAKFMRVLADTYWLPGKDGKPKRPTQLCFTDLPGKFQKDANSTFIALLHFKPDEIRQLAAKTGIDAAILDFIREHDLSTEELRTRLGLDSETDAVSNDDGAVTSPNDQAEDETDGEEVDDSLDDFSEDAGEDMDNSEEESSVDDEDDAEGGQSGGGPGSGGKTSGGAGRTGTESGKSKGQKNKDPGDGHQSQGGGGHSASDRENIISSLLRQLQEATSTGVAPSESGGSEELRSNRQFQEDTKYRHAVVRYEKLHGRLATLKDDNEPGHDVDSFLRKEGSFQRKLARRIEVKGKGVSWDGDEIVELSDRQFNDAQSRETEDGIVLDDDFDYWLYVVEEIPEGGFNVLPIRNPALRSAHFEFRAGTWRHMVEQPSMVPEDDDEEL